MAIRPKFWHPFLLVGLLFSSIHSFAVSWFPFGPDGGDARSLAVDPRDHEHLYLGTTVGWIYESHSGGRQWKRLARVGNRDDLVLDNIAVDSANSRHLLVGAWVVDRPDGGLFISEDAGLTWASKETMQGQSIRALAESPSTPRVWVAGTLTGVRQSDDNGMNWHSVSPEGSSEIHEVESVAIDPTDPRIIYAGTWHLPWKTTDGGGKWLPIKEGIVDDSDVFSIIVDPEHRETVYASACSGIYKSENAGTKFQKVEGIPSEARRTRVLMQDPKNHDTVFAGTTEGLFRTGDAGKIWIRMTSQDVIVNDIYIDSQHPERMLIATDRGGVLASDDGGSSFRPSNSGFAARHLSSFAADGAHPATVYVGVLNDKQLGGVFRSDTGGLGWTQQSDGLDGSDVFSLAQAPNGTMLAGTGHGIYRLKDGTWGRVDSVASTLADKSATPHSGRPGSPKTAPKRATPPASRMTPTRKATTGLQPFDAAVYALAVTGDGIVAATSHGLLKSGPAGDAWVVLPGAGAAEFSFVASAGSEVLAAGLQSLQLSKDSGRTWKVRTPPAELNQLAAVALDGQGGLWAAGREGVFVSVDDGASWRTVPDLYVNDANSLFYDERRRRMFVTTGGRATFVYAVQLPERKVTVAETGWNLRFVRPVGDYLVGITPFDGVVVQPRMVDSPVSLHP